MSSQAFDDIETVKVVAKRLGKHVRTIMRWTKEPDGLPFIRIGQVPYLHIPTTQQWVEHRIQRPNPPRPARRKRVVEKVRR
jgi:hypothetical protein